ncbi:hypothetical protein [Photobacterium phosphoreum]|uniref:hypothetical protein n=1 Tax=Photobacterium phosphoreum TaxID=659 RepID=UPI001E3410D1|nr:hypothetical protein [Photobacterium phosphoreum]MCD9511922.1 hypothetical protein [Photobacterium phosphoreum]
MEFELPNVIDKRELSEACNKIIRNNSIGEITVLIAFAEKVLSWSTQQPMKLMVHTAADSEMFVNEKR